MSIDLYLKNAQVVTETEVFHGWVTVEGEKIAGVVRGDQEIQAVQVIDLQGCVLLPGVVDAHVHFNEPGRENWEGYRTGTMAAMLGRDDEQVEEACARVGGDVWVANYNAPGQVVIAAVNAALTAMSSADNAELRTGRPSKRATYVKRLIGA